MVSSGIYCQERSFRLGVMFAQDAPWGHRVRTLKRTLCFALGFARAGPTGAVTRYAIPIVDKSTCTFANQKYKSLKNCISGIIKLTQVRLSTACSD